MKDMLKIAGIFAFMVTVIPLLGIFSSVRQESQAAEIAAQENEAPEAFTPEEEGFAVLDHTTGQVIRMTMSEYVKGAVLAEMPASFNDEALKAQAVAAHTYAVRRKQQQTADPDPELMGAYISNDSSKYQAYFSPEQAEYFYGEAYEEYDEKVTALVNDVINEIIVYNGEPIVAAFHSTSAGLTESAEVVWGNAVDYLVPVESNGDEQSPSYYGKAVFTSDELYARLTQSEYGVILPEEKSDWLEITGISESGTVTAIAAGDKILSGMELRVLLNLKSACFEFEYDEESDAFTFTTKGSGHGVGLSQYGANVMAENGSTYKDILLYYYRGAEITEIYK